MRNSKHGLQVLVSATMAVLGVMAFAAVGAQAQTHAVKLHTAFLHNKILNPAPLASPSTNTVGTYLVNLSSVLLAKVAARQIGEGELLVPARDLIIRCTAFDLEEGKVSTSVDALAKGTFLGCLSLSHSSLEHLPCTLTTLGTITASALVLPIVHNNEPFILFEPDVGQHFTNVSYKSGTECPLPLNNPLLGSVVALIDTLDAVAQLILFSEGVQLLVADKLTFGGNTAYINGHGEAELAGTHQGQKLGIH